MMARLPWSHVTFWGLGNWPELIAVGMFTSSFCGGWEGGIWLLQPTDLLNDHQKQQQQHRCSHVMTHLTTSTAYNDNSRLNHGHQWRTTCSNT